MNNANVILSPNLSHGQGRSQELLTIVSSRLPSLYRSAYRLLGNVADAEDAVQDALFAAYRHLDQFEDLKNVHLAERHRAQFCPDAAPNAATPYACFVKRADWR
jgi:Sigma-70 region 2